MSTPETPDERRLAERAKQLFDESTDHLDGRTRSRLTQARHAALQELERARTPTAWRVWGPISGVAAAALVAVVMLGPLRRTSDAPVERAAATFDDLEIVADVEDFELIENLEFYAWLDSDGALPNDG